LGAVEGPIEGLLIGTSRLTRTSELPLLLLGDKPTNLPPSINFSDFLPNDCEFFTTLSAFFPIDFVIPGNPTLKTVALEVITVLSVFFLGLECLRPSMSHIKGPFGGLLLFLFYLPFAAFPIMFYPPPTSGILCLLGGIFLPTSNESTITAPFLIFHVCICC